MYQTFTITLLRSPRIHSVLNSSVYFNLSSMSFPRLYFTGVNLSDHEMVKLVTFGGDCSSPGNATLHSTGAHVTQDGGAQYLLNPYPASGLRTTMVAVAMEFLSVGEGLLCFRYEGAVEPSATMGWREIGSWSVTDNSSRSDYTHLLTVRVTGFDHVCCSHDRPLQPRECPPLHQSSFLGAGFTRTESSFGASSWTSPSSAVGYFIQLYRICTICFKWYHAWICSTSAIGASSVVCSELFCFSLNARRIDCNGIIFCVRCSH